MAVAEKKAFELGSTMVANVGQSSGFERGGFACSLSLSDEQRRFVQTVRDLAQREFRPRALHYMDGTFPWENMRALAELGVLGMAVPEEYGGLGLPVFDTALVLEEIAKTCYVTAMAVLGEVGVQTRIIATYAPERDQGAHPAGGVQRRAPSWRSA